MKIITKLYTIYKYMRKCVGKEKKDVEDQAYLESINGEETTENAFLETSPKHYNVVFFIHGDSTTRELAFTESEAP